MRRMILIITSCATATALVACSDPQEGDDGATVPAPTTTSESPEPGDPETSPEPDDTATDTPAPTEPPTSTPVAVPTDAPAEVMLPAEVLGSADQPREEDEEIAAWWLPESCEALTPQALTMRTLTQGTGEFEEPVGVHQVVVFEDAEAAVTAADDLIAAMQRCAEQDPGEAGLYVAEDVAVGAQGQGLALDYYGTSATGELDDAMGTYLAATRRGSAVTLVAADGGEATVATARENVVEQTSAAWELLCRYDSEGC